MRYLDRFRRTTEETEYVCSSCRAGFEHRRQVCPECGGYSIRRREWGPLP